MLACVLILSTTSLAAIESRETETSSDEYALELDPESPGSVLGNPRLGWTIPTSTPGKKDRSISNRLEVGGRKLMPLQMKLQRDSNRLTIRPSGVPEGSTWTLRTNLTMNRRQLSGGAVTWSLHPNETPIEICATLSAEISACRTLSSAKAAAQAKFRSKLKIAGTLRRGAERIELTAKGDLILPDVAKSRASESPATELEFFVLEGPAAWKGSSWIVRPQPPALSLVRTTRSEASSGQTAAQGQESLSGVVVIGSGPRPLGAEPYSLADLSFAPEIDKSRPAWKIELPYEKNRPTEIQAKSESDLTYGFEVRVPQAPSPELAPRISLVDRDGSYERTWSSSIRWGAEAELISHDGQILDHIWSMDLPDKSKEQRARIRLKDDRGEWLYKIDLYRAPPTELSARASVLSGASLKVLPLVDFGLMHWTPQVFGSSNSWLSRNRWGVVGRLTTTIGSQELQNKIKIDQLTSANLELRYNLRSGLWNRSEVYGLIGAAQFLEFNTSKIETQGLGVYWARMMPRPIARMFEWVPVFQYPKYVDMDFVYFMNTTTPRVRLGTNWALNFHGKVFWSNQFYGDAGFGVRSFGFRDERNLKFVELSTLFATMGLGLTF